MGENVNAQVGETEARKVSIFALIQPHLIKSYFLCVFSELKRERNFKLFIRLPKFDFEHAREESEREPNPNLFLFVFILIRTIKILLSTRPAL